MSDPRLLVRRAVREDLAGPSGADAVPADALVLVACSGGADSLALALAARAERSRVGAVVVDHGLRAGSADEASATAEQLRAAGLDPVEVVAVTVPEDSADGPEAAAREVRHRALHATALRLGAAAVLLGHTLDDQAETVLLGLARGSGLRSLAGMPRARGLIRRPLLDLRRDVVRASLPADAVVVDDPHNADDRYTRARVRHRVLPVLERELGPGVAEALARTAALARDDADALAELADEVVWDLLHGARDEGTLDVDSLAGLHRAVLSRVVRTWLVDAGCPPGSLSAAHVRRVTALVTAWKGQGGVALPGGVEAYRAYGRLCTRPTAPPLAGGVRPGQAGAGARSGVLPD
ncbi:MAG: tRNA lysidine(34) synthetase TilS [Frankiales bacterium]|nr:tRNA lysidine(34) synthetase TilS [Frankiales bacterium]